MRKTAIWIAALLLVSLVSTQAFAFYDSYLRFFVYVKKQKKCKEGALCADAAQTPSSIRVSNGSPYRYRCTGQIKVNVSDGENSVAEVIRVDKFINPNVSSFVVRQYAAGQKLTDLNTSGVDCTAI